MSSRAWQRERHLILRRAEVRRLGCRVQMSDRRRMLTDRARRAFSRSRTVLSRIIRHWPADFARYESAEIREVSRVGAAQRPPRLIGRRTKHGLPGLRQDARQPLREFLLNGGEVLQ